MDDSCGTIEQTLNAIIDLIVIVIFAWVNVNLIKIIFHEFVEILYFLYVFAVLIIGFFYFRKFVSSNEQLFLAEEINLIPGKGYVGLINWYFPKINGELY